MTRPQKQPDGPGVNVSVDHQEQPAGTAQQEWPAAPARVPTAAGHRRPALADDEIDLVWLRRTLAKRWRLLGAVVLAGVGVAAALVLLSSPAYEATATLIVPGPAASGPSNANAARSVLSSPAVLAGVNQTLQSEQLQPNLHAGSIFVDPVAATSLLRLRVRMGDPASASRAATLLAERGTAAAREMREKSLSTARPALDADLQKAAKELEASEVKLLEYRRQARIEVLRSEVDGQLAARRTAAAAEADVQRERARYQAAMAEMERLGGRPDPAKQDQNAAMMAAIARIAAESRTTLSALENVRKQPGSQGTSGLKSLDDLYQREGELRRLERQVEIAEEVHRAQLVRVRQMDVVQAVPLIELADTAVGPASPVGRDLTRKLALGLVLSMLLGVGLVVILEVSRA